MAVDVMISGWFWDSKFRYCNSYPKFEKNPAWLADQNEHGAIENGLLHLWRSGGRPGATDSLLHPKNPDYFDAIRLSLYTSISKQKTERQGQHRLTFVCTMYEMHIGFGHPMFRVKNIGSKVCNSWMSFWKFPAGQVAPHPTCELWQIPTADVLQQPILHGGLLTLAPILVGISRRDLSSILLTAMCSVKFQQFLWETSLTLFALLPRMWKTGIQTGSNLSIKKKYT